MLPLNMCDASVGSLSLLTTDTMTLDIGREQVRHTHECHDIDGYRLVLEFTACLYFWICEL